MDYSYYRTLSKNDLQKVMVRDELLTYSLGLIKEYDGAYIPKPVIAWAYQKGLINDYAFHLLFVWTRQYNPTFGDYSDVTGKQLHYRKTLISRIQEALQSWSEGKPV